MSVSQIYQILSMLYIVWSVAYLIFWGIIIRNNNIEIAFGGGKKPSFGEVIKTIGSKGYYPLVIAIGLYFCDVWLFSGNLGTDRIAGEFTSLNNNHLDALIFPGSLLYFFLAALCLNSAENVRPYKSPKKNQTMKMTLVYSVWKILNIALIMIAFYLYFSGEDYVAAWFLICNVVAFLIVRIVRSPDKWRLLRHSTIQFLPWQYLTIVLLGILQSGVVIIGGWLYLVFLQLQTTTGWLLKLANAVDTIRHQERILSIQYLLGSVLMTATAWVAFQFVTLYTLRQLTRGKSRVWVVIPLNLLPMMFTLWIWIKEQNLSLSTILLLTGSVSGFLFLRLAPKKSKGFKSLYTYTFFYGLILGAVCLVSNGVEGVLSVLIFQLFILMVGIAVGGNTRLLISKYDIKAFI